MNDALQIYLKDHLAGSNFAVELIQFLRDQTADTELARFAAGILIEVEMDVGVLRGIIDQVGDTGFDLKQAAAWVAEKASRFKLHHEEQGGLGTFEALEVLSLGILGKAALWRVLSDIAKGDSRMPALDFAALAASAHDQYTRVEAQRMRVARTAFAPGSLIVR